MRFIFLINVFLSFFFSGSPDETAVVVGDVVIYIEKKCTRCFSSTILPPSDISSVYIACCAKGNVIIFLLNHKGKALFLIRHTRNACAI